MLTQKGSRHAALLAMTATPIPRTLTLAQYGEMDVSRLDEMPPGRQPIDTRVATGADGRRDRRAGRHLASGQQAYWVCPMVREQRERRYRRRRGPLAALKERFGDDVVLVHGQLRPESRTRRWSALPAGRRSCWWRPR
jgi:ATP-dependent DNA helicase RecG